MKVKNIMFSGVMAAILGATGANAAINVASQGYVDSKVGAVETNVANTYLTQEDAADTYATTQYVTENVTNILGDETDGLIADVAANAGAIADLESSKADSATTLAGYGITDAYTKTEVDDKVADVVAGDMNEALASYAKTADVASTYATKDALSAVETTANAAATKTYVDTELGKKADTTAVEAITNSLSNYATTEALNGVKATAEAAATKTYVDTEFAKYTTTDALNTRLDGFATDAELKAVDDKFADYTTTEGLTTKLADYAKQVDLEAEVTARDTAVKAVDAKLADYTKTTDLDAGFVSESEMTEFKTANTAAIGAKVAQSDYDTKVEALEAKDTELAGDISDLETALAKKITAPAACETQDCVLSINKATGTITWVPLTEPVSDYLNN